MGDSVSEVGMCGCSLNLVWCCVRSVWVDGRWCPKIVGGAQVSSSWDGSKVEGVVSIGLQAAHDVVMGTGGPSHLVSSEKC